MSERMDDFSARFEEGYNRVCSPRPVVQYRFTEQMLIDRPANGTELLLLIQNLAANSDIDSLRLFLKGPLKERAKASARESSDPTESLTYCVAPMLIDRSGNEAFAHDWMEAFGHTREKAVDYMLALWMQPMVGLQVKKTRLGLATIADIFELRANATDSSSTTPFEFAMGRDPGSPMTNDIKAQEFGYFLRICHPDRLPSLEMKDKQRQTVDVPLCDFMLARDNVMGQHLLPAVIAVYGAESDILRSAMRASLQEMLDSKKLSTRPRKDGDIQWEALHRWGDAEIGTRAWNTLTSTGRTVIESLAIGPIEITTRRLDQLEMMGVDIQAHCDPKDAVESQHMRLLDMAVKKRNAELVGHLLARGFDPELESIDRKTHRFFSAATLALQADPTDPNESNPGNLEQIQSLIRAHLAKKQALSVIDELGLDMKAAKP